MQEVTQHQIIELDYNDLLNEVDLTEQIATAFGVSGVGVLTVKNVPGFVEARGRLLPLAHKFANLPEEIKAKYVDEASKYSFGWSHGKESLQGVPDASKGSYYANPQYDKPVDDEDIIARFPAFVSPNIWPKEELPELEFAFKEVGQIIVHVGTLLAKQCDRYVHSQCPSYPPDALEKVITTSLSAKGRLLHYFANAENHSQEGDGDFSSWCGWHNDHGSLTGLCSAMFMDASGAEVENTDPSAGLYCRSRDSSLVKVGIPKHSIGFQIGETAQVQSGGVLQATPHAVRGSSVANISRETFAVFMEPNWDGAMNLPAGRSLAQTQSQSSAANLPKGVPPLAARWHPSDGKPMTFGEFTEETLKNYY